MLARIGQVYRIGCDTTEDEPVMSQGADITIAPAMQCSSYKDLS